jgi:hypothetical protein
MDDLEAVRLSFVRFVLGQSKYPSAWYALHDASMPPMNSLVARHFAAVEQHAR